MRRGNWFVMVAVLAFAAAAFAGIDRMPMQNYPVRGGANDPSFSPPVAPEYGPVRNSLDLVGTAYTAGMTYYDYQHNGTAGKMIGVDNNGMVHVVWMRGQTPELGGPRHIYYNIWDPATSAFQFAEGEVVDVATRAGYTSMAVMPDGWAFPAFHEIRTGDPNPHAAVSEDFLPGMGAFTTTQPAYCFEGGSSLQLIWPKIAIGRDSTVHIASTESPASGQAGDPQRIYYSRGTPTWDNDGFGIQVEWATMACGGFREMDTVMVIAPDICASKTSDRVAIVWSKSRDDLMNEPTQYNNDLYAIISEDGGLNWGQEFNITNFEYPDWNCASQDTAVCNRDTFRVYTCASAIFDMNDNLHVAFTTRYYWSLEGTISRSYSDVWHWDEFNDEYANIAHGYWEVSDSLLWTDCGAWQVQVQRPSLAVDWETGYLYCSFQRYDTLQVSEAGFPQGEAYLAVSRNCGRSWSEAVNVTQTVGANNGRNSPAGQCASERDITIADRVTGGFVHMSYIFDLDAGGIPQEEGISTNNPVKYQRIPVNEIPWLPIHNPGFPALRVDSTGFPGRLSPFDPTAEAPCALAVNDGPDALRPESFRLYQNYPNPFNPTTNIQFDLVRDARVTLKVFNVLGQNVATLYDGRPLAAGVQSIAFDGANLASGVYVYRLEVDGVAASRKMVLMK